MLEVTLSTLLAGLGLPGTTVTVGKVVDTGSELILACTEVAVPATCPVKVAV